MKIDFLQDETLDAMGKYLNRLSKRQQVVASNIANIDTPGYKTKEISFHATMEELLADSSRPLRSRRPEHNPIERMVFTSSEPEVFEAGGLTARADGNDVNIDKEMLKLGQTAFGYSMITQLLRTKFRTIASSIQEGRYGL